MLERSFGDVGGLAARYRGDVIDGGVIMMFPSGISSS